MNNERRFLLKIVCLGTNAIEFSKNLATSTLDNLHIAGIDSGTIKITIDGHEVGLIFLSQSITPKQLPYIAVHDASAGVILFNKLDRQSFLHFSKVLKYFKQRNLDLFLSL